MTRVVVYEAMSTGEAVHLATRSRAHAHSTTPTQRLGSPRYPWLIVMVNQLGKPINTCPYNYQLPAADRSNQCPTQMTNKRHAHSFQISALILGMEHTFSVTQLPALPPHPVCHAISSLDLTNERFQCPNSQHSLSQPQLPYSLAN